ncbi:biliverdin-producing heme oxygenase [uncultured Jatrophihabitans sp.]|uniref:biliverdin-producing heme oxygenase n=1 Tax=uncultured Jatrophihabitans sp. TaxID=1610747 RepID=UPI0035CA8D64
MSARSCAPAGGEDALNATAQLLRQRTASTHARVEDGLALLDPALTPARLRTVLERFHGFWHGTEPVLDRWADVDPGTAASLDWPRRRRTLGLRADLAVLGASDADVAALPVAAAVFDTADTAQAFGWLYVSEGSALGGAVISRHLVACDTLPSAPSGRLATFTPYPEGPGPMWRSYLARLDEFVGDDQARAGQVADAAARTFDSLATWLSPLMEQVAA